MEQLRHEEEAARESGRNAIELELDGTSVASERMEYNGLR